MPVWAIVLIIVAVVVVLALVVVLVRRGGAAGRARKQEQAREHLHEANQKLAGADRDQAIADEHLAGARRQFAEAQQKLTTVEREAKQRFDHVNAERAAAQQLRAKAEKLAPGLAKREQQPAAQLPAGQPAAHSTDDGQETPRAEVAAAPANTERDEPIGRHAVTAAQSEVEQQPATSSRVESNVVREQPVTEPSATAGGSTAAHR